MGRARSKERATLEEVEAMPAVLLSEDVAHIMGYSVQYVARLCRDGILKDCAVKTGNSWTINKAKALAALGLD